MMCPMQGWHAMESEVSGLVKLDAQGEDAQKGATMKMVR